MSPQALRRFFETHYGRRAGVTRNCSTGHRVANCVPMHTFGLPFRIEGDPPSQRGPSEAEFSHQTEILR